MKHVNPDGLWGITEPMSLGEQLNDLDRAVLGAAPVDRGRPAAPYDPAIGELAPLGRSLQLRAALFSVAAVALGLHVAFGGRWKMLLLCLGLVLVPAMLLAKLSTNAFPAQFPEAPAEALATGKVSRSRRLMVAGLVAIAAVADLLFLHGRGDAVLLVVAGLPAVVLWAVCAEVAEREDDDYVLASRVEHRGRFGRGIYRVPTG